MAKKMTIGISKFVMIGLSALLLIFCAKGILSLVDRSHIEELTHRINTENLPDITETQRTFVNLESLRRVVQLTLISDNPTIRRNARIDAQAVASEAVFYSNSAYQETARRIADRNTELAGMRNRMTELGDLLWNNAQNFLDTINALALVMDDREVVRNLYAEFHRSTMPRARSYSFIERNLQSLSEVRLLDQVYMSNIYNYCATYAKDHPETWPICEHQQEIFEQYSDIMVELDGLGYATLQLWREIDEQIYTMRDAISSNSELIISAAMEDISQTMLQSTIRSEIFLVVAILLALAFIYLVQKHVVKPMLWITNKLDSLESGGDVPKPPAFLIREVGSLAGIISKLDNRLIDLYSINSRLEEDSVEKSNLKAIMNAVFSVSIDGYYIWRPGELHYISPGIKRFLGFEGNGTDDLYVSITGNSDNPELEAYYDLALGLGFERHEGTMTLKNGHPLHCEITSVPITLDSGRYLLSYVRDISLQKQNERELRRARDAAGGNAAMKSAFLASMSHELRTPLNGVIGLAQLAMQDAVTEKEKVYIGKIVSSGRLLLRVINDILDFSKLESGKMTLLEQPFRLSGALEQVRDVIDALAQEKQVRFSIETEEELPDIYFGDEIRLVQILLNLCNNALKFTPRGTISLTVSLNKVEEDNMFVLFSVQDTGIGMDKAQLAELFKPYTQVESSFVRSPEGTGLGLVIAKQLVELMGGNIMVRSSPGVGSVFTFVIPMREVAKEEFLALATDRRESLSDFSSFANLSLLLVEDNSINQEVLCDMLGRMGIEPDVASTGIEAVEMVAAKGYNGILMDIEMPVMDGITATKLIRKMEGHSEENLPIIALTAHVLQEAAEQCRNAGMNDILSKPVEMSELRRMLHRWFGEYLKRE